MMTKSSVQMALSGMEEHPLASEIVCLYEQWEQGRRKWLNRVREVLQYVYATSTRETTNVSNPWSHSTHIPKLTQIHDNLAANYASALFSNREFFTFHAGTQEEALKQKRNAIINYLTTKHDASKFVGTMKQLLMDWVQTGNCFCSVEYVREMTIDPVTNTEVVQYEGPQLKRISPYDIVFDYTASSFAAAPKVFVEIISRGELQRRVEDHGVDYDLAEFKKYNDYRELVAAWKDAEINKYLQHQLDGFDTAAQYLRGGKVEIMTFVGDIYDTVGGELHRDRMITIVDRRFVIQNKSLFDLTGQGPILHCAWRKRPDNLWGQGPLDNLVGMQYLINHLENARADAFDQMLSPDRVHVGDVEIEKNGSVTNYYIDDGNGSVSNLAPDTTVLNADNQIALKEAQMEAYAGAPREALGIRSPGEKTAFEIQRLEAASGRLFQHKLDEFEELVEDVLNAELQVAVFNLNTTDVAMTQDDDLGVVEFINITRDDLSARGRLKPRGASHFAKRAQLVQELQGFEQVLLADQNMIVHFPAKKRAMIWNEALGFDKFGLYEPFGQIAESLEAAQMQEAAQGQFEETQQASITEAEVAAQGVV